MNLQSGKFYWPTTSDVYSSYPPLEDNIECDVLIIGGLDENTTDAKKRDTMLIHKKQQLIEDFNKLFPDIKVKPDFYLSAIYGGTHDGMPIIGIYDELPNWCFLMAYGDNGVIYSTVLSKIITELITKGSSPNLNMYLQNRSMLNSN